VPESPDLAPSDFCLFGKLKGALGGHAFDSTEELLLAITGHRLYRRAELESVFDAWKLVVFSEISMKHGDRSVVGLSIKQYITQKFITLSAPTAKSMN
jgi:hypothetical protein